MVRISSISKFWLDDCPEIRVSGGYLVDFGFAIGSRVVVDITHGQIVIRLVDIDEDRDEEADI
jgi:hypothetical protein